MDGICPITSTGTNRPMALLEWTMVAMVPSGRRRRSVDSR
jgi:hypothetical protein